MSGADRNRNTEGEHFQEAIARHQLALQTELKRSSSLPTAMFDASDPMLEARLCEATESIFRSLREHDVAPDDDTPAADLRLERVGISETAMLVRACLRGDYAPEPAPDLREHEQEEYFAILAETSARAHGAPQQRAARILCGDSSDDLRTLDELVEGIARSIRGAATGTDPELDEMCRRLAGTVLRVAYAPGESEA